MKNTFYCFTIIVLLQISPALAQSRYDINKILGACKERYEKVDNYICSFNRIENIGGKLKEQKNIVYKFKKPFSIYMKWTEGTNNGSEALFVRGKYDNKMVVHLGGIFKFIKVSIDPNGNMAMKNNRHPITEAHLGVTLEMIEQNYRNSRQNNEGSITYSEEEQLDGRTTMLFKAVMPDGKGFYGHIMYINIDKELLLPVRTAVYDWQNNLMEMYYYKDLKINVGLTEKDFDTHNRDYGF